MVAQITDLFQSFIPGQRLVDGGDLQTMANLQFSAKSGIVAFAGGGQASATPLTAAVNSVDTVVTNNDSVMLPLAIPGRSVTIINNTGQTLAVFGQVTNPNVTNAPGDTIAASGSNTQQATATGVTQLTAVVGFYNCAIAGQWRQKV